MITVQKKPRNNNLVPVFLKVPVLNLTVLSLPGAKCAAIGAYVIEGGLSCVCLLFPLPFVDDELPLEMGQELEVLLLLGHSYHLHHQDEQSVMLVPNRVIFKGQSGQIIWIPLAFRGKDSRTSSAGRR